MVVSHQRGLRLPFRGVAPWYEALFAAARAGWWVNTPYVFGGRHQHQGGLDCAGYVALVFGELGVDVDPDHGVDFQNAQRIMDACDPVTDPRPGDLVFFERTYPTTGASHLGIVLDPVRGIMLDDHLRVPYGPGETYYGSDYWDSRLIGFGRVQR